MKVTKIVREGTVGVTVAETDGAFVFKPHSGVVDFYQPSGMSTSDWFANELPSTEIMTAAMFAWVLANPDVYFELRRLFEATFRTDFAGPDEVTRRARPTHVDGSPHIDPFVDRVLLLIEEVCGPVFISEHSRVCHFLPDANAIAEFGVKLGLTVGTEELIVDIAQRLRQQT